METTKTPPLPKLSTLLREGAAQVPHCMWKYTDGSGCCALGTISYALKGYTCNYNPSDIIFERTGVDLRQSIEGLDTSALPEASGKNDRDITLFDFIVTLNDQVKMSREDIATWLESVGL